MTKKRWIIVIVAAVFLLAAAIGAYLGVQSNRRHAQEAALAAQWEREHITINDRVYERNITALDLHGVLQPDLDAIAALSELTTLDLRDTAITIEQYDALHAALPMCEICWSVPFRDDFLESTSETLSIRGLSEQEIDALAYFPALRSVDIGECDNGAVIEALKQRCPECEVHYNIVYGGNRYPESTDELTVENISADDLRMLTELLPNLSCITLTQSQEDPVAILDLMDTYPDIRFNWETELLGVSIDAHATELDFSEIKITDLDAFESIVSRLPDLTHVEMLHCDISNEDMDALNRRHENIKFVWMVKFHSYELRSDTTALIPCIYDLWFNDTTSVPLKYLTDLECLDLGHHDVESIEFVRYMPKLRYLLLGDTDVRDLTPLEAVPDLIYLEIFMTPVTDYTPLLGLKKLQSLNLSYSDGQPEVIAQMTWLDYVRWTNMEDRYPSAETRQMVIDSLPDTYVEFEIGLSSTGGKWRQHQNYYDMRDMLNMYYMYG